MIWIVLGLLAVVGFFVVRPALRQMAFGQHLTNMTNVIEQVEATRSPLPIGQGGGSASLPHHQAKAAEAVLLKGIAALRGQPRHVVTRELIKNAILAEQMGRSTRAIAIDKLLGLLIEEGVAMPMRDFERSYL